LRTIVRESSVANGVGAASIVGMITIRPATWTDVETLRSLAAAIWREYYPAILAREQIEYMLDLMYSPEAIHREMAAGVTWELVSAEAPVGHLAFTLDQAAGTLTLHKLYLVPRLHGQGLGRRLLDHVKDVARGAGAQTIRLQVNKRNTRAIRAYARAGFHVTGAIVAAIGGGFVMDDFVMAWEPVHTEEKGRVT